MAEILNACKIFRIRVEGPPTEKPIYELRILKPRAVKLKGVVEGTFRRVPFEKNRKMVRDIGAFNPGSVGP